MKIVDYRIQINGDAVLAGFAFQGSTIDFLTNKRLLNRLYSAIRKRKVQRDFVPMGQFADEFVYLQILSHEKAVIFVSGDGFGENRCEISSHWVSMDSLVPVVHDLLKRVRSGNEKIPQKPSNWRGQIRRRLTKKQINMLLSNLNNPYNYKPPVIQEAHLLLHPKVICSEDLEQHFSEFFFLWNNGFIRITANERIHKQYVAAAKKVLMTNPVLGEMLLTCLLANRVDYRLRCDLAVEANTNSQTFSDSFVKFADKRKDLPVIVPQSFSNKGRFLKVIFLKDLFKLFNPYPKIIDNL